MVAGWPGIEHLSIEGVATNWTPKKYILQIQRNMCYRIRQIHKTYLRIASSSSSTPWRWLDDWTLNTSQSRGAATNWFSGGLTGLSHCCLQPNTSSHCTVHNGKWTSTVHTALITLCTELYTVPRAAPPLHSKFTPKYTLSSLQVESTCQLQLTNCFTVLLIDITQRISKCIYKWSKHSAHRQWRYW